MNGKMVITQQGGWFRVEMSDVWMGMTPIVKHVKRVEQVSKLIEDYFDSYFTTNSEESAKNV